ncbi:MAG: hypothetical protein WD847_04385 [Pirellulales bacterium]
MNAVDFLQLASELETATDEARLRTAVSRAYYASLHQATDLVIQFGVQLPRGTNKHAKIPILLQNAGDPTAAIAGQLLDNLRGDRNHADYDVEEARFGTAAFARQRVATAKKVFAILADCDQEPLRSTVRTGIRDHAERIERMHLKP